MVSVDSLNLDVLELIFAYLSEKDLLPTALVNHSFFAGVVPRLYRTLVFLLHHSKRYPKVQTPFSAILAHPQLAVHVRKIDVRTTPLLNGHVHTNFVRDCGRAILICPNLESFVYTPTSLASFLPVLQNKTRLKELRVDGKLTTDQAEMLLKLNRLRKLVIDFGSWNVLDLLPRWVEVNQKTLTSLTLYMSTELNEGVLESALSCLPGLRGLHVVGCPKVNHSTVLRLVSHTPLLESLAVTIPENTSSLEFPTHPLLLLRHLALDTRSGPTSDSSTSPLSSILALLKSSASPLSSFSIKAAELKSPASHSFIKQLLDNHARTLKKLSFLDCTVEFDSISKICKACIHLEQLNLSLPIKDIISFAAAISPSESLRTIVDIDSHISHGPRPSLTKDSARYMMWVAPALSKVVSDRRIWTGHRGVNRRLYVSFERQSVQRTSTHWFLPHEWS